MESLGPRSYDVIRKINQKEGGVNESFFEVDPTVQDLSKSCLCLDLRRGDENLGRELGISFKGKSF